jgi:hypothetical protein
MLVGPIDGQRAAIDEHQNNRRNERNHLHEAISELITTLAKADIPNKAFSLGRNAEVSDLSFTIETPIHLLQRVSALKSSFSITCASGPNRKKPHSDRIGAWSPSAGHMHETDLSLP